MANPMHFSSSDAITPARRHFAIVPSDTVKLDDQPKAIYCQAAGDIAIVDEGGNALIYTMAQGQILPIRPTQVKATGTTGTFYGWF